MGGSSEQVTGYRYYTNFLLFIGNPIEKLISINFDKRGWVPYNQFSTESVLNIDEAYMYGENEGGVYGDIDIYTGTSDQQPNTVYKDYMESIGLKASGFPYQSYLVFRGSPSTAEWAPAYNQPFYVGNSGYMKEMLLWPKRIHVRNDGRGQWYDLKAEIKLIIEYEKDKEFGDGKPFSIPSYFLIPYDYYNKSYYEEGRGSGVSYGTYSQATNKIVGTVDEYVGGSASGIFDPEAYCEARYDIQIPGIAAYLTIVAEFELRNPNDEVNVLCAGLISYGYEQIYPSQILGYRYRLTAVIRTPNNFTLQLISKVSGTVMGCFISWLKFDLVSSSRKEDNINGPDINPIHKIREILTDDTAMNKPEMSVNDVNFMKAADRVYDEGLGVSWSITEKLCIDAINELCYHIEAGIRVNRQTGLYEMVLFRDDWFEEIEIHTIAESKIKSIQYEITNADEVINQVNVNYYDRDNIKNSSFSISENGLIQTLGRVNAETLDFPYFMNMRNAEIVANWKLKQLSTGVFKGSFTTGWRAARKWNRYDLIRLPWSKRWTGTILVRIMSINLGGPTNNEVSIDFIEVVPSTGMMNTTIVADDPGNTQPKAPKPCNAKVFELPYFEAVQAFGEREVNIELMDNPEAGYLCAIAEKPQNNSLSAALHVDNGNGFERVATINYCETAYLDQSIDRMSSAFIVKNVGNIASVRLGSQIFINDEIMIYQSYDATTKVLTVKRGAFDSIPQNHSTNSILYFADDFVAVDQTLYVESEIVEAKVLTTTPSGVLSLDNATTHDVEFNARAIRPYPPANVKINGEYYPERFVGDLFLSWVDRNRPQQTGGEIIGWFDDGVTREAGVNYRVRITTAGSVTVLDTIVEANALQVEADLLPSDIGIEISSFRDGLESYQKFLHTCESEGIPVVLWTPLVAELAPTYYFDAEDALSSNSTITSIPSKIGSHTATPTTGLSTIKDGMISLINNTKLRSASLSNFLVNKMKFYVFFVVQPTSTQSSYTYIFMQSLPSGSEYNSLLLGCSDSKKLGVSYRRSSSTNNTTIEIDNVFDSRKSSVMLCCDLAANKMEVWVNGLLVNTVNPGSTPFLTSNTSFSLILGGVATQEWLFNDLIGCNVGFPTRSEIDKYFGWAAHKYEIVEKLPSNHPYKVSAPII